MEEQAVISSKERYRTLLVSGGGLFSQSASTMLLSFVLASMITSFHISGTAGGFISTITNIGMLVGGLIFGTFSGPKWSSEGICVDYIYLCGSYWSYGFCG